MTLSRRSFLAGAAAATIAGPALLRAAKPLKVYGEGPGLGALNAIKEHREAMIAYFESQPGAIFFQNRWFFPRGHFIYASERLDHDEEEPA